MKNIKVGVVGVGYLGQHHARIYSKMPGVNLVGVADIDGEKARVIAGQTGCQAYSDFTDLLGKVQAVSIVVPTVLHHKVALRFLQAGVDVLLEKPMTVTLEEADHLISEAENNKVLLQIGHLERFNSVVRALEGRIEKPRFIESHRLGPFVDRGTDVHVVLDLMIHDIDIILSLVNSPVELIRAVGIPVISSQIDIANARIEFANGCVANVTASRVSREKMRKIRIFQPDAYLSLDYLQQEVTVCQRRVEEKEERPQLHVERLEIQKEEPLQAEIVSFIECVLARKRPLVAGQEGREALRVALEILNGINRYENVDRRG
jgi:predicted dehydrogenase